MAATNVKPGDLAVVVRCDDLPQNIGVIVNVLRPSERCPCGCMGGAAFWHVKSAGRELVGFVSDTHVMNALETDVPDVYLRPIRGPGDDAVDEMVKRVGPAPMTLTEVLRREEMSHG